MTVRAGVAALAWLALAATTLAQPRAPIGRFVVDVRGVSSGLPSDLGWTPLLPPGADAPRRSLGLDLGAHVYVLRLRGVALGLGASWLLARGTTSPPDLSGISATPIAVVPAVTTRLSSLAPQLSLNFGHSLGWSYLSAGLGQTRVESEATLASSPIVLAPRESGWVKTINFGGGARWMIRDHVGVGVDLRWHKLSLVAASPTHPGAPRATLITAGAGIVLK